MTDKPNKNTKTKAWELYEKGRLYNNRLVPNQYRLVNTNIEFFAGNQWIHIPQTPAMSRLPKPVFNILKRITSLFVASITSSAININFEPLSYYDGSNVADPDSDASIFANAEVRNLLEKFKMDYRIREALYDGAQTGDYCAHFYFDPDALPYGGAFGAHRGEIQMELVDGINVMFGNPASSKVENQPYILIVGRDTCDNLAYEAERFQNNRKLYKSGTANDEKNPDLLHSQFQPDSEYEYMAGSGSRVEIPSDDGNGKALYVLLYTKVTEEQDVIDPKTGEPKLEPETDKDGNPVYETEEDGKPLMDAFGRMIQKTHKLKHMVTTIHVTKATRTAVIYEDVDTGLTRYPIAWGNWEKQKNQYHGRAFVTGLIPNQIYINTQFAMVMRHLQLLGFPKTVYNADLIPSWDNTIGKNIGVHGLIPGQTVESVAYNLQPADMSNQILTVIDKAINYTKDCLGATDAQMGNVKPENTSALMVLQSNAEVPLENIRAGLYEWMEDIGAILLDMMGTYYGERPIVRERTMEEPVMGPDGAPQIDPMTGLMQTTKTERKVVESFDFSQFKHLWLNMSVDAGATNNYSEISMIQTLDNLRQNGVMDTIQYLERIPDKMIPRRQELIDDLKARMQQQTGQPSADQNATIPDPIATVSGGSRMPDIPGQPPAAPAKAEPTIGGDLSSDMAIGSLPQRIQGTFANLPGGAKNSLMKLASLKHN